MKTNESIFDRDGILILSDLSRIVKEYGKAYGNVSTREKLTESERELWDVFIKPLDCGEVDDEIFSRILEKHSADMELTAEEEAVDMQVTAAKCRDALSRTDGVCGSLQMINRAQRCCKLLSLDAPDEILCEEEKEFYKAFDEAKKNKADV